MGLSSNTVGGVQQFCKLFLRTRNKYLFSCACAQPQAARTRLMCDTTFNRSIDESQSAKHWCIMADFQLQASVIHKKKSGCGSKPANTLVTRYVLPILPKIFALGLFILVFEICAIIHQQLVTMLRELMRFVYTDI